MIMEVVSIYSSIAALGVSCVALMVSADKKSAEHVGIIVFMECKTEDLKWNSHKKVEGK